MYLVSGTLYTDICTYVPNTSAVSSTHLVVDTINKICKLRDTSGNNNTYRSRYQVRYMIIFMHGMHTRETPLLYYCCASFCTATAAIRTTATFLLLCRRIFGGFSCSRPSSYCTSTTAAAVDTRGTW